MSDLLTGRPREGRRFKAGNSGADPITIKAGIGDGSTGGSATPLLKFEGTTSTTKDATYNITTAAVTGAAGVPNNGLLCSVASKQTSGALVVGKVYQILSLSGTPVFTNVHSGSTDTVGLVFTATGTTPTAWGEAILENTQQYWIPLYALA
jgi:hypothetical protein